MVFCGPADYKVPALLALCCLPSTAVHYIEQQHAELRI